MFSKKKIITSLIIGLSALALVFVSIAIANNGNNLGGNTGSSDFNIQDYVGKTIEFKYKFDGCDDYVTVERKITADDSQTITLTESDINDLLENVETDGYTTATGWTYSTDTTEKTKDALYNFRDGESLKKAFDFETQTFDLTSSTMSSSSSSYVAAAESTNNSITFMTLTSSSGYYQISSLSNLIDMRDNYINNAVSRGGTFKLTNDIDMGGRNNPWTTGIGTSTYPFSGTFDGQGYTISNILISDKSSFGDAIGLFGVVGGASFHGREYSATIQNLWIDTFKIYLSGDFEEGISDNVGILCGYLQGTNVTIENISAVANETDTSGWLKNDDDNWAVYVQDLHDWSGFLGTGKDAHSQSCGGLIGTIDVSATFTIQNIIFRGNVAAQIHNQGNEINVGGIVGSIGSINDARSAAFSKKIYSVTNSFDSCIFIGSLSISNNEGSVIGNWSGLMSAESFNDNDDHYGKPGVATIGGICGVMYVPAKFNNCISNITSCSNPGIKSPSYAYSTSVAQGGTLGNEVFGATSSGAITAGYIVFIDYESTYNFGDIIGVEIEQTYHFYGNLFFTNSRSYAFDPSNINNTYPLSESVDSPFSGINLLSNCGSNEISQSGYSLTNYSTFDRNNSSSIVKFSITQEGASFDSNADWFIDDRVNDGYPVPMTLLRIKDYDFTVYINPDLNRYLGGENTFKVNDTDITPTENGDTLTYTTTVKGSQIYTINMIDNLSNLFRYESSIVYYLGVKYQINIDHYDNYNINGPTMTFSNNTISTIFNGKVITYDFDHYATGHDSYYDYDWTMTPSPSNPTQDKIVKVVVGTEITTEGNNFTVGNYTFTVSLSGTNGGHFGLSYWYTENSTDSANNDEWNSASYQIGREYTAGTKFPESTDEYIKPVFERLQYKLDTGEIENPDYMGKIIAMSTENGEILNGEFVGSFNITDSRSDGLTGFTGYYDSIITASGNSVTLKLTSTGSVVSTVTAESTHVFENNVAYWGYISREDGATYPINSTVEMWKVGTLIAYFDPVEYTMDLHYDTEGSKTSTTFKVSSDNIDLTTSGSIKPTESVDGKTFKGWLLKDVATNREPYTFNDGTTKYVTVNRDESNNRVQLLIENYDGSSYSTEVVLLFTYDGTYESIDGTKYYLLTGLICYKDDSTYSYGDLTGQSASDPLIRAHWGNTYTMKILNDANGTIWRDNSLNNSHVYAGVGNQTNQESGYSSIKADISFGEDNMYAFASSEKATDSGTKIGLSFFKVKDFTSTTYTTALKDNSSYYYVYAYGYRISGWTIYFNFRTGSNNSKYYLVQSTDNWSYTLVETINSIDGLNGTTTNNISYFLDLISTLDDAFAGIDISKDSISLTMTPVWQAVEIKPTSATGPAISSGTFTYNKKYEFESGDISNFNANRGESISHFTTTSGNVVVLSGVWNYYQINSGDFVYNDTNNRYDLSVTPLYADDIYKVNLTNIPSVAKFSQTFTDYSMYAGSQVNAPREVKYTYEYSGFGYETYSTGYIEEYVTNTFVPYMITYNTNVGISTDYFARTIYGGSSPYIYLAHSKSVGELPTYTTNSTLLIAWLNGDESIAYKTGYYEEDIHDGRYGYTTIEVGGVWEYDTSLYNSTTGFTFIADFYRKTFKLDWNILLDGADTEAGYVILTVEDKDQEEIASGRGKSGTYLLTSGLNGRESTPTIYDITGINFPSINGFTTASFASIDDDDFVLYAGCDYIFTTYDQSRDVTAANGNYRDAMVGYRLDNISFSYNYDYTTDDTFDTYTTSDASSNRYTLRVTAESIEDNDLRNNETIYFTANFTRINYTVDISIDNEDAGRLNITSTNGAPVSQTTSVTIGFTVDDNITIQYHAYIGYEFKSNAITLSYGNKVIALSTDMGNQSFTMTLNAQWLQENYYNLADSRYTVPSSAEGSVDIGEYTVNTKLIDFAVKVKVYDGTTLLDDEITLMDGVNTVWRLGDDGISLSPVFNKTGSITKVSSVTQERYTVDIYGLDKTYNGKAYAILSSWAYIPRNPTNNRNYYTTYSFPNEEIPTARYAIGSDFLWDLVRTSTGQIVPVANRTIYFCIEVYEQYNVKAQVERVEHDTNSTTRTTQLSSSVHNILELLTVNAGATDNAGIYTSVDFVTYEGLTFNLSSTYDEKRYSGVEYSHNDEAIEGSITFTRDNITRDSENEAHEVISIRYIPKDIQAEIRYYVKDNSGLTSMTESEVSNIITASLSADGEIYIDSDVTLGVRSVNDRELNRYILKYSVGEEVGAGTTMGYNTAEARYQATHRVTDNDYELEAVIFNIILEEKVNDKILAEFSLTNEEYWLGESRYLQNTRAISGENYGEISVYVDGEEIDYENVSIVNGQNVEVRVRLNYGYTLRGYRQNVADIVVLSQIPTNTETTILTINNFNAEENGDGGIYSIYISKDVYTASLTVEEGTLGNYSITSTSSRRTQSGNTTTLDNIYIGKSIIFNNDPIANEKLENYYYLNRAGEEVEISLGENGAVIVTEELLRAIEGEEIRFGVNTSKLYMLSIEDRSNGLIESIETSLAIKYEDGSPIYYEPSVSITVDMRTIAGKYVITANIYGEELIGTYNSSTGELSIDIQMDKDKRVEILVNPQRFTVNTDKYVYEEYGDLVNDTPTASEVTGIDIEQSVQEYAESAEVSVVKENREGTLTRLEFTSEGVTIRLSLEGGEIIGLEYTKGEIRYSVRVGDTLEIMGTSGESYSYEQGILRISQGGETYTYEIEQTRGEIEIVGEGNERYTIWSSEERVGIGYISQGDVEVRAYYTSYKLIESN